LQNNFLYKGHYINGEWASDHYTIDEYKIIHSYSIKYNSWNTLKVCQPSSTVSYAIHNLLTDNQIQYKLSVVEIPFDITPTNGVELDDLQLFLETSLYQPYCPVNKNTEFKYNNATYYTKRTRNSNSRGMKIYTKNKSFVRCELELKKNALKKLKWKDITSICLTNINISKYFRLLRFDTQKIAKFIKRKKIKRNPISSFSIPFMKNRRRLSKLTKNWLRFTKCISNWNDYFQNTIERY
jgi:hypothetical protein